jgi:hypothetical protein
MFDDRVEELLERRAERIAPSVLEPTGFGVGRAATEIRAGTERTITSASDDDRAQIRMLLQPVEQVATEICVQGVPPLGSVDAGDADAGLDLPEDGHVRTRR